jgi:hypothetical protein
MTKNINTDLYKAYACCRMLRKLSLNLIILFYSLSFTEMHIYEKAILNLSLSGM